MVFSDKNMDKTKEDRLKIDLSSLLTATRELKPVIR